MQELGKAVPPLHAGTLYNGASRSIISSLEQIIPKLTRVPDCH